MELSVQEVIDELNDRYHGVAKVSLEKDVFKINNIKTKEEISVHRCEVIDRAYSILCEEKLSFADSISKFKLIIKDICLNLIYFNTENICEIKEVIGYED